MNRRKFIGWLAGTAVAAALAVLPRAYGVPASGLVGKPPADFEIRIIDFHRELPLVPDPSVYRRPLLCWTGDGE